MSAKNAPVWAAVRSAPRQYPWMDHDESCEVCVVGGGLTGALCALRLAQEGIDTVLITAGQLGGGLTADCMPCAEYDSGASLRRMSKRLGPEIASTMFEMGISAVAGLEELAAELGADCCLSRRDCLLFTDDDNELESFNKEFMLRRHAGLDCAYVSRSTARDIFDFELAGGIISRGLAAEFDPFALTHMCAARAAELGARVYENTKAVRMEYTAGRARLQTSTHRDIDAGQAVIASAAACADIIDGLSAQRTSFIAVSRPITQFSGWPGRCVIRNWSSPRVTCASSPDGRLCISGLDTAMVDEQSRLAGVVYMPRLHERRFRGFHQLAKLFFPQIYIPGFEAVHACRSWQTSDGLPIIGTAAEHPGCIFAACCGTGGVLMSELASHLVAGLCRGEESELLMLFSPERRGLKR